MATERVWETKEATFSLRNNPNASKNEKAPNLIGTIKIGGREYELSAWAKVSKTGAHWFSGTVKEPFKGQNASKSDESDQVPF
jgi:hypothetical protein